MGRKRNVRNRWRADIGQQTAVPVSYGEKVIFDMITAKFALLCPLAVGLCSCSLSDCENTTLDRILSPDGTRYAAIYERNCGATTSASIHLSILSSDKETGDVGNALVTNKVVVYTKEFRPEWKGNSSIYITIPTGTEIFRRARAVDGVKLSVMHQ
jgi:hypothetical protein